MSRNAENIQEWIVSYISRLLEISKDDIDVSEPFEVFGLDSAAVVGLTGDLGDWLRVDVDPTFAYDYPTIEKLSQVLAQQNRVTAEETRVF